jgi:ring-1,2-phenylacetyl-CoA epoxidase subunit PaaC
MSDPHDNPYDALAADDDGGRWAFGTGFGAAPGDPAGGAFDGLAFDGPDGAVPAGLDPAALARYCLALGDDALVYSHRLQQWLTRLPELEEETAVANIALDLLGQARLLLARAGAILGRTEDDLAFSRNPDEFRNVCFAEHADRDFAELTSRLLLFSAWRLALLRELSACPDPALAAIAAKGAVELAYHRDYAARWVVRLGDGTPESRSRMRAALATWWPLAGELFLPDSGALASAQAPVVNAVLDTVLAAAGLPRPSPSLTGLPGQGHHPFLPPPRLDPHGPAAAGGRAGRHTPALTELLAELQSVARAHPDATW